MHRSVRLVLSSIAGSLFLGHLHAQLVFIPDTQLRSLLELNMPGAVDGAGYLDTQAPSVLATDDLHLDISWSPVDLTGLEALDGLGSLSLVSGHYPPTPDGPFIAGGVPNVLDIPAWPAGLTQLAVSGFAPTALPAWPDGLVALSVGTLTGPSELPAIPAGVQRLTVSAGPDLLQFPDVPAGATQVDLTGRAGVAIPALPGGITNLELQGFNVTTLAVWPSSLQYLKLESMPALTDLVGLPEDLRSLSLWDLPVLAPMDPMPARVDQLSLLMLPWTSIADLPDTLMSVFLHRVDVTALPELPESLTGMDISYLPHLTCLPALPEGFTNLLIDIDPLPQPHTPIACLPNLPPGLVYHGWFDQNIPITPSLLCTVLNSACDAVSPVFTGSVFWDQNGNGTREAGEPGYSGVDLGVEPGGYLFGVPGDGAYELPLPMGAYTVSPSAVSPYIASITPASIATTFSSLTDVDAGNDFAVALLPDVQDLTALLTDVGAPRPGFDNTLLARVHNAGTIATDGSVTLEVAADQSIVSTEPAADNIAGNIITWSFTGLEVEGTASFSVIVHTDLAVPLGTALTHTMQADPLATDATAPDNVVVLHEPVVGSFDPNDKQVTPAELTTTQVANGERLDYTIRFQNTGTFPAERVLVLDTLSADLQWPTFRFEAASHPCAWQVDHGVLSFRFDGIQLPDSNANEAASHGFVRFSIVPVQGLLAGAVVPNSAAIQFDFNLPVITNTAEVDVLLVTGVEEARSGDVLMYPNPVQDALTVQRTNSGAVEVTVVDAMGRTWMRSSGRGQVVRLPMAGLMPGTYMLELRDVDGPRTIRFVKE